MSKIEVDQVTQQSGTTLTVGGGACKTATVDATTVTIGRSGGTVSLASGATQSGFGRSGTVNWQTSIKTASFTAASGEGYFCDTNSVGAFTVTLPASPSAGDIVAVSDYANTFDTANLTIGRNSSNIEGAGSDFVINVEGSATTFVYADSTKGWIVTNSGNSTQAFEIKYIAASGGTESTCGNFKIHKFTGPGTFTVSCGGNAGGSNTVSYMVIGGGAGGGRDRGGGGGAGGFREGLGLNDSYTGSPLRSPTGVPVSATAYPITVGGGGSGGPNGSAPPSADNDGNNSVFSTITSAKGGGGANGNSPNGGQDGGSGGGGAGSGSQSAGTGNTPPVSPPQGNTGGLGGDGTPTSGGGGGGAGSVGQARQAPTGAGQGAIGVSSSITGSAVKYAGGGGAGNRPGCGGAGSTGGTFPGVPGPSPQADRFGAGNGGNPTQCATANTGAGGGGADTGANGANGGSGIVVIRYKYQGT
jgi:hypothetical protein